MQSKRTQPECPSRVQRQLPVARSHTQAVASSLAVTAVRPSGDIATACTTPAPTSD